MLDIILTVVAWRRGWKAWALLPFSVTLFLMLLTGFSAETIGVTIITRQSLKTWRWFPIKNWLYRC
jgi:hypothetical protein